MTRAELESLSYEEKKALFGSSFDPNNERDHLDAILAHCLLMEVQRFSNDFNCPAHSDVYLKALALITRGWMLSSDIEEADLYGIKFETKPVEVTNKEK